MDLNAIVFDIQKFSIHDGPGIRTTVFLKGCPLRLVSQSGVVAAGTGAVVHRRQMLRMPPLRGGLPRGGSFVHGGRAS